MFKILLLQRAELQPGVIFNTPSLELIWPTSPVYPAACLPAILLASPPWILSLECSVRCRCGPLSSQCSVARNWGGINLKNKQAALCSAPTELASRYQTNLAVECVSFSMRKIRHLFKCISSSKTLQPMKYFSKVQPRFVNFPLVKCIHSQIKLKNQNHLLVCVLESPFTNLPPEPGGIKEGSHGTDFSKNILCGGLS